MTKTAASDQHAKASTELIRIARTTPWFMSALLAGASLRLPSWCIGAGAVRNMVWDALHGYTTPSPLSDVDFAYFDPANLGSETERAVQQRLEAVAPELPWEATNQAAVHLWFEGHFGHTVTPLTSLSDAVASWPEYATAVGLVLKDDGEIHVIAPHGLEDLFGMRVRRNPSRVSPETYATRVREKRYAQRWPRVVVEV